MGEPSDGFCVRFNSAAASKVHALGGWAHVAERRRAIPYDSPSNNMCTNASSPLCTGRFFEEGQPCRKLGGAGEGGAQCRKIVLQCSEYRRVRCLASRTTVGPAGRLCLSGHSVQKRKRRTNGDIADVMLEKENLLSMSHNAMIPLPFLTASTEAEIVCIVDVKGNIRERLLSC